MEAMEESCRRLVHSCEGISESSKELERLGRSLGRFNRAFASLLHCAALQAQCVAVKGADHHQHQHHHPQEPARRPQAQTATTATPSAASSAPPVKRGSVWRRIGPMLPPKLQQNRMKVQVLGVWRLLRDKPAGMFLSDLAGTLRISRIQTNEILTALLRIGEVSRERKSSKGVLYQLMAYVD